MDTRLPSGHGPLRAIATHIRAASMKMNPTMGPIAALVAFAALLQGCAVPGVSYRPRAAGPNQTLRFAQGVGTLSEKSAEHELFMYPTFKLQGPSRPTFTIGYANNSSQPQNFSTENVRAFYRGSPVALYTYTEKVEEIRREKVGKQVLLAVVGAAATAAATNAASRQTYTSNYSGSYAGTYSRVWFYGSNTIRVYDPTSGLLAGAAMAGATGLGIAQIEYNAQNEEAAAEAILQANTVDPQRAVSGQLILKSCCDKSPGADDKIRFEVTTNGRVSVFEFLRQDGSAPPPMSMAAAASAAPAQQPPKAVVSSAAPMPVYQPAQAMAYEAPAPQTPAPAIMAPPEAYLEAARTAQQGPKPMLGKPGGESSYEVEHMPEVRACNPQPTALLAGKQYSLETYSVACVNGEILMLRCEARQCKVLR